MHPEILSPRRRNLILGSLGALALSACGGGDDSSAELDWRMPAETEPQQAVLMASLPYDYKSGWSVLDVQAHMIAELVKSVPVIYLCNTGESGASELQALTQALLALGVPRATIDTRVRFKRVAHAEFWVRDYGGIFMRNGLGEQQVVDFDFDGYGYNAFGGPITLETYAADNDLAVRVAASQGLPVLRSPLVCEGGNLHFNGKGVVVATEVGLLSRNPGWTRAQVEDELKRVFNLKKVLWVPRNLATDAHVVLQTPYLFGQERVYNLGVSHIDEMIAWVDARTVVLPEVSAADLAAGVAAGDPIVQINHAVLSEAYDILSKATDQDGQPLTIVRVPEPGTIIIDIGPDDTIYQVIADLDNNPQHRLVGAESFVNGESVKFALPASYMNYLVTNGLVLIPKFYKNGRDPSLAQKDAAFRSTIASLYPGRRIVQVDVDAVLAGGGGMHCISQQIPL